MKTVDCSGGRLNSMAAAVLVSSIYGFAIGCIVGYFVKATWG